MRAHHPDLCKNLVDGGSWLCTKLDFNSGISQDFMVLYRRRCCLQVLGSQDKFFGSAHLRKPGDLTELDGGSDLPIQDHCRLLIETTGI